MPETEGSTHHREAGAGPGVKKVKKISRAADTRIPLLPADQAGTLQLKYSKKNLKINDKQLNPYLTKVYKKVIIKLTKPPDQWFITLARECW